MRRESIRDAELVPEEKRADLAALLADFASKLAVSHQELAKLIGRMSFSHTPLFGDSRERSYGRPTRS